MSMLDWMLSLDVTLLRALQPWQFLHVCWLKKALFNHIVLFCVHGYRELELFIEKQPLNVNFIKAKRMLGCLLLLL